MLAEIEAEESANPMKALERRTAESKREMDIIEALDEIKAKNTQMEGIDAQAVLDAQITSRKQEEIREAEEEDAWVKELFYTADDGEAVRRVAQEDKMAASSSLSSGKGKKRANAFQDQLDLGVIVVKKTEKKQKVEVQAVLEKEPKVVSLVSQYGSDSE